MPVHFPFIQTGNNHEKDSIEVFFVIIASQLYSEQKYLSRKSDVRARLWTVHHNIGQPHGGRI